MTGPEPSATARAEYHLADARLLEEAYEGECMPARVLEAFEWCVGQARSAYEWREEHERRARVSAGKTWCAACARSARRRARALA